MGYIFERGHGARVDYTPVSDVLNDNEWEVISEIAQAGEAALYWDIGDTKQVHLEGTVGTLSLNTDLWVYIIGINHEDVNGITFQGFKTAQTNGVSVALTDSKYDSNGGYTGEKYFTINHWGTSSSPYNTSHGGWKGCDLRYDILGSTDTAPSGYGSVAARTRTGYNASLTTAINPVSNTLMSCLPYELRVNMKPMTVYTNNKGYGGTGSFSYDSIDYLPLLADYEIFGVWSGISFEAETNYQTQYEYYKNGSSKQKYKHSSVTTACFWWNRSPYRLNSYTFCIVGSNGAESTITTSFSGGLAPMFLV